MGDPFALVGLVSLEADKAWRARCENAERLNKPHPPKWIVAPYALLLVAEEILKCIWAMGVVLSLLVTISNDIMLLRGTGLPAEAQLRIALAA